MLNVQTTRRAVARLGTFTLLALALTAIFASAAAAAPATLPQPFPWSKTAVAATGDYIADSYTGVGPGHVFENVTADRLLDILSSNGSYYIVFAGPEHATGQAALAAINEQAKADGITKIYHFDPYLDGFQLDITDTIPGSIGSWTGGTSMNYGGPAKVNEVWRLITDRLPSSAITTGGALYGFRGNEALLFSVTTADRANVEAGKVINGSYKLRPAGVPNFDAAAARTKVSSLFHKGPEGALIPSSERSQYAFFKRLYDASASNFNSGTPTVNKIGGSVEVFSDADFPNGGDGFALKAIDIKELYNLLNTPGEHAIFFAGQGCHNTQAIIESVALKAKELGLPTVYVADFALNSNVRFGTGENLDQAEAISATGGLWVRAGATATSNKFSYLYGELTNYFGNWVTENSSKKNNSIAYYPNGDTDGTLTTNPYANIGGVNVDNPDLSDKTPNARRLQVPFLIAYNKDAREPVTHKWLHLNSASTETTRVYTEYMLELSWVRNTPEVVADTSLYVDGLTRSQFASEAVAALDGVLRPVKEYVAAYSAAPMPTISGTPAWNTTLTAQPGTWFPVPEFSYQWYANDLPIAGATARTLKLTSTTLGKKISVKVTGTKAGFPTVGRTSRQTGTVIGTFTKSPAPTISGTLRVGSTLKVVRGTWSPPPTFTYKWYANGVRISGATSASFRLTSAQRGKRITVSVTAKRPYFTTITRTSRATARVQ